MELNVESARGIVEGDETGDYGRSSAAAVLYLGIWDELSKTCFDSGVELIGGNPN